MNYQDHKDNITALCNAIIALAAKDLADSLKILMLYPDDSKAAEAKDDTVSFFQSDWFSDLSEMDGKQIIRLIIEEVKRDGAVSNRD